MAGSALHERYVSVSGVRSPVLEGGGHGPEAVVFVHGNPGSSRDWRLFATAASEIARVLAVDMPGFGRADKPEGFDYTVAGYARHLAGVLDACEIRRAHLVLHDFGGPWGLTWAAQHPDAFCSVVLIDAGVLPGYQWHLVAQVWLTPVAGKSCRRWPLVNCSTRSSRPSI
jgi:pimeloyl-ACP methyl ester carboxylesterase